MKAKILLPLLLVTFMSSYAQTLKERVQINGGHALWENFMKEMFLYPSFQEGVIYYKNGQVFKRLMNYNRILETLQFIDEKNDTLALANEEMINQVTIGNDLFIYDPMCLKTIASHGDVAMYKHETMKIADIRRRGAFGIPNSTSAIDNYNQVFTWMSSLNLDINELVLLSKVTTFFVSKGKNKKVPASKKNILDMYSKDRQKIKKFIDSEKISFSKERDLIQLAEYISKL